MGTFKLEKERLITIKDGIKEIWEVGNGETSVYLRFDGKKWNLVKTIILED